MRETLKTACFVAVAGALAISASMMQPERRTAAILSDQGELFYPDFKDAQAVKTIEVVDYDEATATARPFKVESQKGRWLITSNNNYPVDVGDRLVKTASALMELRKDQVRSDSVQDHAKCGVVDPLDQKAASLQGRGKHVTLRDAGNRVLADFIFGKPVEGKAGFRFVRVPQQKRIYMVKTDADPSAQFSDWVNSGIARIPAANIRKVMIVSYASDAPPEQVSLTHDGGQWKSAGGERVNLEAVRKMAATLENLKIVDARPKPPSLAKGLREGQLELSLETAMSLQQRGFSLTQSGRIVPSEGEMLVETNSGISYHLRFGELAGGDNRYLFITANGEGASALNARFADWYYVITNAEFQKLRLKKKDVS